MRREAPLPSPRPGNTALALTTLLAALVALWIGPAEITPRTLWEDEAARRVVLELRLPRILAALLVGAGLATAGALLQALLRNPLSDPAILGVSGGAALGAASILTLGAAAAFPVPLAAFVGAVFTTLAVWRLGSVDGAVRPSSLLLAGVAVNALAGASVGLMLVFADDGALRSTTFWLFGTLNRATLGALIPLAIAVPLVLVYAERRAIQLDQYQLGEREARQAGLGVRRLQWTGLGLACLLTALAVAVAGVVGFVGLMVPHLLRLRAPDGGHRHLLLGSALGGGLLLLAADIFARTVAQPAELPIGLITALLGAPFFLVLLRGQARRAT